MSSKISKEKVQLLSKDHLSKIRPLNIKEITIPFSKLIAVNSIYIYNGKEKIPFKKRHPEYQAIFRNEFSGELRKFFNDRKGS